MSFIGYFQVGYWTGEAAAIVNIPRLIESPT